MSGWFGGRKRTEGNDIGGGRDKIERERDNGGRGGERGRERAVEITYTEP